MNIQEIYNLILESSAIKFTGAGIIFCTEDGKILILKKSNNTWCMPGGKPEGDETPQEAAKREAKEETGKTAQKISKPIILQYNDKTYYSFISIVNKPFDVEISDEHKDYSWVPYEHLKKLKLIPPFRGNVKKIIKALKQELNS